MNFDWSELAFANKKQVKDLKAVFIAAPRELSSKRFTQLVKTYLPQGNIVLGIAKEAYIEGFENQPQFKTLKWSTVQAVIGKVNDSNSPHKIYTLTYFQREAPIVIEKLKFKHAVFVNGSWQHAFHYNPIYYTLMRAKTSYELVSPFVDEAEAKSYAQAILPSLAETPGQLSARQTAKGMLAAAQAAAKRSFDYNFQTGAALGRHADKDTYELLHTTVNKVVPYHTYAMHHGASRETHFSPTHDLNYYDTIHAEVSMLIAAQKEKLDLSKTTLFINLMPCPACARMLSETDIAEIVYSLDHSDGYAVKLLQKAGKKVRRIVV